jgi:hypothetical protein
MLVHDTDVETVPGGSGARGTIGFQSIAMTEFADSHRNQAITKEFYSIVITLVPGIFFELY